MCESRLPPDYPKSSAFRFCHLVEMASSSPVTLKLAETKFMADVTLDQLRHEMAVFVAEREWEKFHTPRNVLLALCGEVGEVAECFQWKADAGSQHGLPDWTDKEKTHLGEELSDVLLYLLRLSDLCGVDLPSAAIRKMGLNRAKYPADKARGRSDKYTAYIEDKSAAQAAADSASSAQGGLMTPRKGTPAEHRTPKESPTAVQVLPTATERMQQAQEQDRPTRGALTFDESESSTVPLWLLVGVSLAVQVGLAAVILRRLR